ncbi:MAG: DUF1134 domain-containing protein [Alphaproteobacteria bacterium]|nr:DUF1134 domain-containing protein [Alphaproteobacteria bacterium]
MLDQAGRIPVFLLALALAALIALLPNTARAAEDDGYTQEEILAKATGFFGETTEGLAKAIEHVFEDQGRPNGFVTGEEFSGAIGVGLRFGKGTLNRKSGASREVHWQGPSVGFDLGGNASKVFVLVYHLDDSEQIYQRFPGVEGTFYFVAGVGVNYQKSGDIILAPIRTGVGLRAGANVGYLHYTKKRSWNPF